MSNGRRILVIDDEWQIQDVIRLSLEDFAFEFHAITQLYDLETALRDAKPDLILLDQSLPDRDGNEVCRELKAQLPNIPVILMTTTRSEPEPASEEEAAASPLGPDAELLKPFRPVTLLNTIYRCLQPGSGAGA